MRRRLHIIGSPGADCQMLLSLMAAAYQYDDCLMGQQSLFEFGGNEHSGSLCLGAKQEDTRLIEEPFLRDSRLFIVYVVRDPRSVCALQRQDEGYVHQGGEWLQADQFATRYQLHPRLCIVKHEDLLKYPLMVQDHIEASFQFLARTKGFDLSRVAWETQAGVVDWRLHLSRVKQQLEQYPQLASKLRRYCYENDDDWKLWLEGVESAPPEQSMMSVELIKPITDWWQKRRYYTQRHC